MLEIDTWIFHGQVFNSDQTVDYGLTWQCCPWVQKAALCVQISKARKLSLAVCTLACVTISL